MATLQVRYDPLEGFTVPDGKVEGMIDEVIGEYQSGEDQELTFGNEIPIDYIRLAIKQGKINWEDVTFHFNNIVLPVNKDGRLAKWPHGFCDYIETVLSQL